MSEQVIPWKVVLKEGIDEQIDDALLKCTKLSDFVGIENLEKDFKTLLENSIQTLKKSSLRELTKRKGEITDNKIFPKGKELQFDFIVTLRFTISTTKEEVYICRVGVGLEKI